MSEPIVIPRSSLRLPLADWPCAHSPDLPICKLCDLADWNSPSFVHWAADITAWSPGADFRHRKIWELVQTARALQLHGLLDERAVGLSVAAGNETLLFYLANHIARIVATDIYGWGIFASREADQLFLVDQRKFAPFVYRTERLKALYMNALDLHFADSTFDFAYSLSSVEHFGGVEAAIQALRGMVRIVKPGGLVIVATECALNGQAVPGVFGVPDIARLVSECGAELIEPIDYRLSDLTLQTLVDYEHDDLNARPHINLETGGTVFTSILLAFRKPPGLETGEETLWSPLLQSDCTLLDKEIEDIRALYPQEPVSPPSLPQAQYAASVSAYTRIPLIGRVWNWMRRPLHDLVRFYINQQAESQAAVINAWAQKVEERQNRLVGQVFQLRRRLRRLEKRAGSAISSDKDKEC